MERDHFLEAVLLIQVFADGFLDLHVAGVLADLGGDAVVGGHGGSVENDTAGTFKASMVADAMMAASRANNVDGEVVIASPTETGVTAFVEFA